MTTGDVARKMEQGTERFAKQTGIKVPKLGSPLPKVKPLKLPKGSKFYRKTRKLIRGSC
jgi:hypothetical protein